MDKESTKAVYKITCLKNGKIYVGQSWFIDDRIFQHKTLLKGKRHCNKELQKDYNLYGESAFVYEILQRYDDGHSLYNGEHYYIDLYECENPLKGYNCNFHKLRSSIEKERKNTNAWMPIELLKEIVSNKDDIENLYKNIKKAYDFLLEYEQ